MIRYTYFLLLISMVSSCKKQDNNIKISQKDIAVDKIDTVVKVNVPIVIPPTPKDTSTKVVVILGSSTAAGYGASRYDSCWVARLNKQLLKDSVKIKVVNLSVPGYVTYHILPTGLISPAGRPQPDLARNLTQALTFKPLLIIINMPTNDISNSYTNNEIIGNYAQIVQGMEEKKVEYIITGTQPRNFPDIQMRQRLKELNNLLKPIYTNHYCDYLEKLSSSTYTIMDDYSAGDGTHLNDKGHKVVFEAINSFPLLNKTLRN
jgi:acyl-CoA thioesterase-1